MGRNVATWPHLGNGAGGQVLRAPDEEGAGSGLLAPSARFFRAAPQVRDAIEKSVAANGFRLALEQPPRKPFYLVGRLGDRDLSWS